MSKVTDDDLTYIQNIATKRTLLKELSTWFSASSDEYGDYARKVVYELVSRHEEGN